MIGEFTNVDNHHSLMKGRGRGGGGEGGRTRQPTSKTTRLSVVKVRKALMSSSLSTKAERRKIAKGERKGENEEKEKKEKKKEEEKKEKRGEGRNSVKNLADGVRKVDERRPPGHSPRLLPLPLSPKKMRCI